MQTVALCALPVMAALLFAFGRSKPGTPQRLLFKGGCTGMCVLVAGIGLCRGGRLPAAWLILCAVAVFAASDVLLEVRFAPGVAAFAVGHLLLIVWILAQGLFTPLSLPLAAVLWLAAYFAFRGRLDRLGSRKNLFLLYPAVLMGMTALAAALPLLGGRAYLPFALGAALFAISDMMVAADVLCGIRPFFRALLMVLYESAVLLMALTAFM